MTTQLQPLSVLVCALGGEGGGVLTQWIVDAARLGGYPAQATSIPGVAQRTGATTYYLEVYPRQFSDLHGQEIVFGLNPLPGKLDLLISSELLEAARQVSAGMSSKTSSMVISSSARVLTTAEKMNLGDGRANAQQLLGLIEQFSRAHHVIDMARLTQEAGTIVSAVMLGCLAGSGVLPMAREFYEAAIGEGGKSQQASLKGFALGFAAIQAQQQQRQYLDAVLTAPAPGPEMASETLPAHIAQRFAPELCGLLGLAYHRVLDYQGQAYAQLYMERLLRIQAAEQAVDPLSTVVTAESLRALAVLMCFDDLIQVADFKSRASRFERVGQEVKRERGDLLKIYDHFKPGIPELASLMPKRASLALLAWDRARQARGKTALSLPLKIAAHSVTGLLMLKTLAACKVLRPWSARFVDEQALIEEWVERVVAGTQASIGLGLEIALCARLIKGYGSTHERGRENFSHIMTHLAAGGDFVDAHARATAVSQAREVALKDEAGAGLDLTLKTLGAPPRAPRYQPIRWMSQKELAKRRAL